MKIAVAASGTRGDVQPYVALGQGLQNTGYDVRLLTSDDFEGLVTKAGLSFCSIGPSIEGMLQSDEWRDVIEGGNALRIFARMNSEMKRRAQQLTQYLPQLLEGMDLIITGASGLGGIFSVAEKLSIPVIQAYVFPLTPTQEFSGPLTPVIPLGTVFNRFSFQIARQALWQSGRIGDVTTRRQLGMPRASFWGPFQALKNKRVPILYGFSRHVLLQPHDWDDLNQITGYWFLKEAHDWAPPSELVDFLNAGERPVYIGFGSMGNRSPEKMTQVIVEALQIAGRRGVLASGWGGLSQADLPDTVFMLPSVPHRWLFPQMDAVVHHGGAGTTAAGLEAGVPSIIIPFFGDQPFWGKRVEELGVGPKPIPRRKLSAERLAEAIIEAGSDEKMRRRAAELGEKIRAEDGVANAVSFIREYVG
jgi:sterol 3beta-glucosyltransferase